MRKEKKRSFSPLINCESICRGCCLKLKLPLPWELLDSDSSPPYDPESSSLTSDSLRAMEKEEKKTNNYMKKNEKKKTW